MTTTTMTLEAINEWVDSIVDVLVFEAIGNAEKTDDVPSTSLKSDREKNLEKLEKFYAIQMEKPEDERVSPFDDDGDVS